MPSTASSSSISVAASIVTTAAERIGDVDPQPVIQNLSKEKVREDWQLEYLDSHQWQILGAPMGLVASIRRCLDERKQQRLSMQDSVSTLSLHQRMNTDPGNLSPMRSAAKRNKNLVPSISPPRDLTHSPCRSVTTVTSTGTTSSVQQPPVMPMRKESQGVNDNGAGIYLDDINEARDTFQMLPEYMGGALPPMQPQRLESLETSASNGSLGMSYNNNVQGSYRQQAYNRANGWED